MNVLSLFDGISCGQVALQRAGIKYDNYYASEIDKYAIEITQKNFPNTIQLGDIRNWKKWKLPEIDLILAGSPCQGFSFAGKQLNFNDPRSKLFFEFEAILDKLNPDFFLLENTRMKKEYQDVISWRLDVEPIEINSSLVSAQNRKRLYWTNIPGITQPENKGILLDQIVHENTWTDREKSLCLDANYFKDANAEQYFSKSRRQQVFENFADYIVPFDKTLKILDAEVNKGKLRVKEATKKGYVDIAPGECVDLTHPNSNTRRGRRMKEKSNCLAASSQQMFKFGYLGTDSKTNRVYYIHGKSVTPLSNADGEASKEEQYLFGCITPDRLIKRQNGQRFNEGKKFYTLTAQDRHGILIEGYIRKLTPVECERLQTLPDGYTEGISNTQRYKTLGNGWTVDVVAHILSFMDPIENEDSWEWV